MLNHRHALAGLVTVAALTANAGAAILVFTTSMDGPSEAPPVASPGIGTSTITWDTALNTMRVQANFSGLVGTTTVAHIHASATMIPFTGTSGVATPTPSFPLWPTGVQAGSYDRTFDMTLASSFNAAFITANGGTPASAAAVLLGTLQTGRAYFNVHSTFAPGGEIRGFFPTPGAATLLGIAGVAALRRRR
ncbi:MAG: CHRD domain-containing protein [Phycisphaerales bacterium]